MIFRKNSNRRWPYFVASRYFSSRRKDKTFASSLLSVIGIAVGTMTLVSVIAVMNGFQIGFIEDILEINSFHIRITSEEAEKAELVSEAVRGVEGVRSALPVTETQTMVTTDFAGFEPCLVRGVPRNFHDYDMEMVKQLNIKSPDFAGIGENEILLGMELADHLGVSVGDQIKIISLAGKDFSGISPEQKIFTVAAVFASGYYEYDRGMGFVTLDSAAEVASNTDHTVIGVKIRNRFKDRSVISFLEKELQGMGVNSIVSWREYNSSFFGALKMEKTAMMVLIGLIFLVVGGNIYQAQKRSVLEKLEEISLLKSLGAEGKKIRRVFVLDGIFIGLAGGLIGLVTGLAVAYNINPIFTIFENLSNKVLQVLTQIVSPIMAAGIEEIAVFSPTYYYMSEVPVRLPFQEALFIFLFAFLSSTAAAYLASKKITTINPSEVLRYE